MRAYKNKIRINLQRGTKDKQEQKFVKRYLCYFALNMHKIQRKHWQPQECNFVFYLHFKFNFLFFFFTYIGKAFILQRIWLHFYVEDYAYMYMQTCILYTSLVKYSFLEPISNVYTYKWSRCIRNFIYLREAFSKLAMEAINPLLIWHPTVLQHHRGLPRENIHEQVSDGNRLTHTWEPTGIIHYPLRIC